MAVSHSGVYVQTPKITPQSFPATTANTKKTIATAGADGAKVVSVLITSTDTSLRLGNLWLTRSATSYLLTSVNVPAAAGTDGTTPTVEGLALIYGPVDNDGQRYIFLESGDTLDISFTTNITSAKEIDAVAIFGNF